VLFVSSNATAASHENATIWLLMYMMKMELIDEKSIFQKFIQKNNAKLPEK